MAWLAVDKDGSEWIFDEKPFRSNEIWAGNNYNVKFKSHNNAMQLPEGTIEKILGYKLTWEDEAVEI